MNPVPDEACGSTGRADFSGLWIPLVTPFRSDGAADAVDHQALAHLVRHYRDCGVSGFVACGTTGETAALSGAEQQEVLATLLAHSDGLPVVMGVGGYNLREAIGAGQAAVLQGAYGLLVAAPHYIRPSQAGVCDWFERIADACDKPLIVYDVPYRTGIEMSLETLQRLARHPRICAIKDCGGSAGKTQQLIADGQLQVLAGEDHQLFGTVAAGGRGAISASAHLQTAQFVEVIRLLRKGRMFEARALWQPLVPLISAMFSEPNPAAIKYALAQAGWLENRLRPPMQATAAR